jgi:hypothetical protein
LTVKAAGNKSIDSSMTMCMLFLKRITLNAINMGAILLVLAILYDIFFVFESIMVNVATSGGPPKTNLGWCKKYPFNVNCRGGDPLPVLFAIPRIGNYQGGSSMLGLGDIILPGLLPSFASRFDESKRRGATASSDSDPLCFLCSCCFSNGYFGPVMVV